MSCFSLTIGEDSQVKSNNLGDSIVDGDADSSRTFEDTSCAADASDEGPPLHEQAHLALPEEVGEEEVESIFRIQISNCSFCIVSLRMQSYADICFFKYPTTIFTMFLALLPSYISNLGMILQVLLSVSCIMVSAKRKVAGRLEIMQSSLHFYGEFIVEGTGGRSVFNSVNGFNYPDAGTMEKGFSKPKMSGRKDFFDGPEGDRGNPMERLDPIQGGLLKGIKRHSRWDLSQVRPDSTLSLFISIPRIVYQSSVHLGDFG